MSRQSFAETVNVAKLKSAGIRAHLDKLSSRGLDGNYATELDTQRSTVETLNNEQEALKAAQKTKTAELDAALLVLKQKNSEADKLIKLTLPQEVWVEFGITAKR